MSIIPLANSLSKTENIIITSSTITSSFIAKEKLDTKIIHQFCPLDKKKYVKSFLNYFKPKKAIFIESELWPNLINETSKRNIKMILLNARISDKSGFKKKIYQKFAKMLLNQFTVIFAQSKRDFLRFSELNLSTKVKFIGNIKFSTPPLTVNNLDYLKLKTMLKGKKIFLATSTHKGEEEIVATIHKNLKNKIKNLITIIVPRHPNRLEEIQNIMKKKDLTFAVRSKGGKITNNTDIYLANTIGELGLFYKISNFSFIGGSMVNIGGHNPIEAIKLNSIPITGSYIKNFYNLYSEIIEQEVGIKVDSMIDLEKAVVRLLSKKTKKIEKFNLNIQKFLKENNLSLTKVVNSL